MIKIPPLSYFLQKGVYGVLGFLAQYHCPGLLADMPQDLVQRFYQKVSAPGKTKFPGESYHKIRKNSYDEDVALTSP
jgi:hypothetical protein